MLNSNLPSMMPWPWLGVQLSFSQHTGLHHEAHALQRKSVKLFQHRQLKAHHLAAGL
jgi:hypothetical protein